MPINLQIQSGFQPQGTDAASKALANVGQTATRAEKELLAYANAQARLARATGDNRGAANIYAQALSQVNRNSKEGVAAQAQLQQAVGRVNKELTGGKNLAQQFGAELKSGLVGVLGPAALATAAIALVGKGFENAQLGAQAELVRLRFEGLSKSAGTTGDAILKALRAASGGEISDLNLQLTANRALLLGVADSADEFSTLMAIARDRAQAMGTTTEDAFNRIVLGVGKAEPELLDELGIVVSATEANERYARELGVTAQSLTKQQRSQALANEVLRQGKTLLEETGGAAETSAAKIQRGLTAFENLKTTFGELAAVKLGPLASDIGLLINTSSSLAERGQGGLGLIGETFKNLQGVNSQALIFASIANNADAASLSIARLFGIQPPSNFVGPIDESGKAWQRLLGITAEAPAVVQSATNAHIQSISAIQMHTQALADDRAEAVQTALQAGMLSQATQAAVLASMEDAAAKEEQAAKTGLLQAQTRAAVDAFMALHPNIDAAGVASLSAAGKIDPLLAQLIQAEIRARAATSALADFNFAAGIQAVGAVGIGGGRKPLERRGGGGTNSAADALGGGAGGTLKPILNERNRIADAQFQYELSLAKTNADKIALYERQLGRTNDKAEQLQIRATINSLRNSGASGRRGKADPQARGLGALAQDRIDLAGTEQQQLAEVNRQLAAGNLTEHQRNTLLEKRLKLEESIADEIMAQQQANVDAQLKTVQDAQARLKEAREAAGLQRALAGGRLTAEQQQAVGLRLQEIALEQEKRRLDISGAETKAGGLTPINGGPIPQLAGPGAMPNPFVAPQAVPGAFAPAVATAPVTVNITLNVDSAGRVSATTGPGVLLNLLGAAHASNAGGGRG